MKIRNDFVSNSSSSSYLIIDDSKQIPLQELSANYTIGNLGTYEFGWGPEFIHDRHSKINFAWIQAHADLDIYMPMLQHILGIHGVRNLECVLTTDWDDEQEKKWGYIDHQSSWSSGSNMELFDNVETLERFLFHPKSSIVLDNDNR